MRGIEGRVDTDPATVFAVLADGWSYPNWVVGVTHVRDVEPGWPAVGAGLRHTLGVWPLVTEDRAEIVEREPNRRLVVRSGLGRLGRVRIEITVNSTAEGTVVTLQERAEAGPVRRIPAALLTLMIRARNTESLRRLRTVAEHRVRPVPANEVA